MDLPPRWTKLLIESRWPICVCEPCCDENVAPVDFCQVSELLER